MKTATWEEQHVDGCNNAAVACRKVNPYEKSELAETAPVGSVVPTSRAALAGGARSVGPPRHGVLLVDGDANAVASLAEVLRETEPGYQITHVATLEKGLSLAKTLQPDVVLLEPDLPDSVGVTSVARFVELQPRIPVVVLSRALSLGAALEAGAQEFVSKPSLPVELRRALQAALARHRFSTRQKAQERCQSLAETTHDLRSPLNTMLGFVELVRAGYVHAGTKPFDECLASIVTSGEELLEVVEALEREHCTSA
jgi:DNA-binding NarL/FixJ family response regulator